MRVLNAMASADASKPKKVYQEYNIKHVMTSFGVEVHVTLTFKKGESRWPLVRLLVQAGTRLEKELGPSDNVQIRSDSYGLPEMELRMAFDAKEDKVIDAIHTLYLWIEHPEKYS